MRILRTCTEADQRVLDSFTDYLKVEKGLARLTVEAYARDLNQFAAFLQKRRRLMLEARRQDVRDYMDYALNRVAGRSVARQLSTLRQLYKHLLRDGHIERDPTINIDSPRQWRVLPKSLARDEVERMVSESAPHPDSPWMEVLMRAIAPCWRHSMREACGFPNWRTPNSKISSSTWAISWFAAKATKNALCP